MYSYYPGCSLHSTSKEYDLSFKKICEILGIEIKELKDWICCGTSSRISPSSLLSSSLPVLNLVKAENEGKDLLVPCAACFYRLKAGALELKENKEKFKEIFKEDFKEEVKVLHPLEILINYKEKIKKLKKKALNFKAVCYYGCLLTRPPKIMQFDNPENPQIMEKILFYLNIPTLDWSYKVDCCGANYALTRTDIAKKLTRDILRNAKDVGADIIVVACPLCQSNLDLRQREIEKENKEEFNLPILYFTQVMGLAFGLDEKELGMERHFVRIR